MLKCWNTRWPVINGRVFLDLVKSDLFSIRYCTSVHTGQVTLYKVPPGQHLHVCQVRLYVCLVKGYGRENQNILHLRKKHNHELAKNFTTINENNEGFGPYVISICILGLVNIVFRYGWETTHNIGQNDSKTFSAANLAKK